MEQLIKPLKLNPGDKVATISPCWGIAEEKEVIWKYEICILPYGALAEIDCKNIGFYSGKRRNIVFTSYYRWR